MRHRKKGNRLGRSASHRKATLANLASSLIEHKKIQTTHAKARATRQFIEPLITRAKGGSLNDRRHVLRKIPRPGVVKVLFDEIAPNYKDRAGGYTRIVKLGFRGNDSALVSQLEFVDFTEEKKPSKKKRADSGAGKKEE
ncbi:MAG: 50S ribosomal protein L17 [Fidelibacterota bacterium]